MRRRSQKLEILLDIQAVSCPGVWIPCNGAIYLSICLLGNYIRTKETAPVFPMMFYEKFVIDKVFRHVFHLSDLDEILDAEIVYMELIQRFAEKPDTVLATFETSARELLFPNITSTPQYSGADLDLLMEPTVNFVGTLAPRLEVSTKTTVKEVRTSLLPPPATVRSMAAGQPKRAASVPRLRSASAERLASASSVTGRPGRSRSVEPLTVSVDDSQPYRSEWCSHCHARHMWHHCAVCQAYQRYFGRNYPGHYHHDCCDCSCPVTTDGVRHVCGNKAYSPPPDSDSESDSSEPLAQVWQDFVETSSPRHTQRQAFYSKMEDFYRRMYVRAARRAAKSATRI